MLDIKLKVPYFSQNDNEYWDGAAGNVQCAPTSNAMLAAYAIPGFTEAASGYGEPEGYYKSWFEAAGYSSGDRGNHDAHTATLELLGLKTQWRTDLQRSDIDKSLEKGFPVVVGLEFGSDGHICIVVGRTAKGYLLHDPFGVRSGAADWYAIHSEANGGTMGAFDLYSWATLDALLFVGGGAWGRVRA